MEIVVEVKVILDRAQNPEDAEEILYKALDAHRNGNAHSNDEKFQDAAMQDVAEKLKHTYKQMFTTMLQEIFEELDKEYE